MKAVTAAMVKELRDRTDSGMMECKQVLVEANGDIEKAIEILRERGQAKAVKKSGRIACEGTIVARASADGKSAVLIEINCETDFVAREERFKQFSQKLAEIALSQKIATVEVLQHAVEEQRLELVSALGENIAIRRMVFSETLEGTVGAYGHGDSNGVRIGSLVVLKHAKEDIARDLAMHVAAMSPEFLNAEEIPAERLEKEQEIFIAQTKEEGRPEAMIEKIVAGKIKKFTTEITLLGQNFVKEPSKTVASLLKEVGTEIISFARYEVGEGIEKKQENFAAEVMAQVKGGN